MARLLWLRLARRLLSAGIPNINLWLCWRTNPATSDIQLKRSFQIAPWDYIGIGDFHRRDTRNRWEGSLEQQQCRTAVLNGIVNYVVGVAVAFDVGLPSC